MTSLLLQRGTAQMDQLSIMDNDSHEFTNMYYQLSSVLRLDQQEKKITIAHANGHQYSLATRRCSHRARASVTRSREVPARLAHFRFKPLSLSP